MTPSKVPVIKSIVSKEQERHIGKISEKLRNTVIIAATYIPLIILKQIRIYIELNNGDHTKFKFLIVYPPYRSKNIVIKLDNNTIQGQGYFF